MLKKFYFCIYIYIYVCVCLCIFAYGILNFLFKIYLKCLDKFFLLKLNSHLGLSVSTIKNSTWSNFKNIVHLSKTRMTIFLLIFHYFFLQEFSYSNKTNHSDIFSKCISALQQQKTCSNLYQQLMSINQRKY